MKQTKPKRKNDPQISRGRKALLKESQRAYLQRKQQNGDFSTNYNIHTKESKDDDFTISNNSITKLIESTYPTVSYLECLQYNFEY